MFATRGLILEYQNQQVGNKDEFNLFTHRICKQAKLISQIITFIWLWVDYKKENSNQEDMEKVNAAKELKKIFDQPYKKEGETSRLMKLLNTDPFFETSFEPENYQYYKRLLNLVFDNYKDKEEGELKRIFPIFNNEEKSFYNIYVDVERFHGQVSDPTANDPRKMAFSIPYPPRPALGEATLTREDLQIWLEDTGQKNYVAENPYIPTTCS